MKRILNNIVGVWVLVCLLAAPGAALALTHQDAFDGSAVESFWNVSGGPTFMHDALDAPSGDGSVVETSGTVALVDQDSYWSEGEVSTWLKFDAQSQWIVRGVFACVPENYEVEDFCPGYAATLVCEGGNKYYLRLWTDNGVAGSAFPAIALYNDDGAVDYQLGATPDNAWHKLTLVVSRDVTNNPLCVVKWDDTAVINWNKKAYWHDLSIVPAGHPGIITRLATGEDKALYDGYSTTFTGTDPVAIGDTFSDAFGDSAPHVNWLSESGRNAFTLSADAASSDGQVLAVSGEELLLVRGTEKWSDVTVSCDVKMPSSAPGLWLNGVVACVGGDGNAFSPTAGNGTAQFTAAVIDDSSLGGGLKLRLLGRNADAIENFPGPTMAEVVAPAGITFDGLYHNLKLVVRHTSVADPQYLLSLYWDGELKVQFDASAADGANDWWSQRVPAGQVGLCTLFAGTDVTSQFDNFQATWDNPTVNRTAHWSVFE